MDRISTSTACALALALGVGCGAAAPPRAAQTEALTALSAAEDANAEDYRDSAYHLELAREQVAQAEEQIRSGQMAEAGLTLERAKADAELARALAREAAAQLEVDVNREHIRGLRSGGL